MIAPGQKGPAGTAFAWASSKNNERLRREKVEIMRIRMRKCLPAATAALALLAAAAVARAQTTNDYVVDTFDDDTTVYSWTHDWGSPTWTIEWDPTVDANTNSSSGSLKFTVNYDLATFGGNNDSAFQRLLPEVLDMSKYTNIHLDIKVDPASSHLSGWGNGALGNMTFYMRDPSWAFAALGDDWIGTNAYGAWQHVVWPIDQLKLIVNATNNIAPNVARFGWQMWSGWDGVGHTNTVTYWIDNVWFEFNTNTAPPPPPTLRLAPNDGHRGLEIVASASDQYARQNIATDMTSGNDYGWVGKGSSPVTYALTLTNFPGLLMSGFQVHVFLTPTYGTESAPDWNQPNLVFLQIQQATNGIASATFRYKTNLPNGNNMLFNAQATNGPVGALAVLDCTNGPLGTWSMTFVNDTNITLRGPDGSSTNFSLPAAAAALFGTAPVRAYFGNQPNSSAARGQFTTFSRVQISGVAAPIDDTFPGPSLNQDPATVSWQWQTPAADPSGIFVASGQDVYWLNWTLPDFGYTLQSSSNLLAGSWTNVVLTNVVTLATQRAGLVPRSLLPADKAGFFRMMKQ